MVGSTPLRFGEVMAADEDWFAYESTLRYLARRRRLLVSGGNGGSQQQQQHYSSLSPTQMGEDADAEMETGLAVARTSSVETVSSWPVEGAAGGREMGASGRVNEDVDAPMSDAKVSSSSVS